MWFCESRGARRDGRVSGWGCDVRALLRDSAGNPCERQQSFYRKMDILESPFFTPRNETANRSEALRTGYGASWTGVN